MCPDGQSARNGTRSAVKLSSTATSEPLASCSRTEKSGKLAMPSPSSANAMRGSTALAITAAGSSTSNSAPSRMNDHGRRRPVRGKRCWRQACAARLSGVAGIPCSARYAGEATTTCEKWPSVRIVRCESTTSPVRRTTSKPSPMTSTMRSLKSMSSCTSGYSRMNALSTGINSMPTSGTLTRRRPVGVLRDTASSDSASAISPRIRWQRTRKSSPSGVRRTLRVLR